ncbi:beta-phosphoglucomutase [Planococcus sp. CPCC 101016]|uniref:beta-phosphoglucomutase n=1 Tax=Planococcus sp. CPCC 101016 TaxID=2599617 RepID=UPI0011B3F00A|nr:beta-phosphoglucomutase [Planococcus sp. CPCC 101016]TWT06472.1 beta-phosphoglucomutase [Planococcus sp. CPCC 101016]
MTRQPKLFIYDLDGILTDTAEFHYMAWKKLAEGLGISFDYAFNEQLKGISRMDSLDRILALDLSGGRFTDEEKLKLATQKNDAYLELIEEITPAHILPGIEAFLEANKRSGAKLALGSASKNAPAILEKLGLAGYFDYIVDAAKVKKGKPDPETFTVAAEAFGIDYRDCVGIEDAAAGVEAINRAGMFSVGVGDSAYLSHADYLVAETSELDFDKVVRQFGKKNAGL